MNKGKGKLAKTVPVDPTPPPIVKSSWTHPKALVKQSSLGANVGSPQPSAGAQLADSQSSQPIQRQDSAGFKGLKWKWRQDHSREQEEKERKAKDEHPVKEQQEPADVEDKSAKEELARMLAQERADAARKKEEQEAREREAVPSASDKKVKDLKAEDDEGVSHAKQAEEAERQAQEEAARTKEEQERKAKEEMARKASLQLETTASRKPARVNGDDDFEDALFTPLVLSVAPKQPAQTPGAASNKDRAADVGGAGRANAHSSAADAVGSSKQALDRKASAAAAEASGRKAANNSEAADQHRGKDAKERGGRDQGGRDPQLKKRDSWKPDKDDASADPAKRRRVSSDAPDADAPQPAPKAQYTGSSNDASPAELAAGGDTSKPSQSSKLSRPAGAQAGAAAGDKFKPAVPERASKPPLAPSQLQQTAGKDKDKERQQQAGAKAAGKDAAQEGTVAGSAARPGAAASGKAAAGGDAKGSGAVAADKEKQRPGDKDGKQNRERADGKDRPQSQQQRKPNGVDAVGAQAASRAGSREPGQVKAQGKDGAHQDAAGRSDRQAAGAAGEGGTNKRSNNDALDVDNDAGPKGGVKRGFDKDQGAAGSSGRDAKRPRHDERDRRDVGGGADRDRPKASADTRAHTTTNTADRLSDTVEGRVVECLVEGLQPGASQTVDLAKMRSFKELWSHLSATFPPGQLPNKLDSKLIYLDADGDWLMVAPDEVWTVFVANATKLLISQKS